MAGEDWKKLNHPEVLTDVERRFERYILLSNDVKEAEGFVRLLQPILEDNPDFEREAPEIAERYWTVVVKCKFIALALLSYEEIVDLFEKNFTGLFLMPDYYDLMERLRIKFLAMPLYEDRDAFKKRLREAMFRNKEFITPDTMLKEGETEKPPTVENWLRNYIAAVGIQPVESIKKTEYLTQSPNVRKLVAEDRKKVEQLLDIFEKLKLSSLTMQGLEEKVPTTIEGKPATFVEGRFEVVDKKTIDIIQELKQAGFFPAMDDVQISAVKRAYEEKGGVLAKLDAVEEEVRALYKTDSKQANALVMETIAPLASTSSRPPLEKVLVILLLHAEEGKLGELLTSEARFMDEFKKYLKEKKKSDALHNLELNPKSPINTGPFLRFIMEERGGMDSGTAARFAVRLANAMRQAGKKEYMEMAYYDIETGKFAWKY